MRNVVSRLKTLGLLQKAPPILGRAAIMLGIGPHSSFVMSCDCQLIIKENDDDDDTFFKNFTKNYP